MVRPIVLVASCVLTLPACRRAEPESGDARPSSSRSATASSSAPPQLGELQEVALPEEDGETLAPHLHATADATWLSWLSVHGNEVVLRAMTIDHPERSALDIARGPELLANGSDPPVLITAGNGDLIAVWTVRPYEPRLSRSSDQGASWTEPVAPHVGQAAEIGFPALFRLDDNATVGVSWLQDGALWVNHLAPDGSIGTPQQLDERTCECCTTSAANVTDGPLLVYRDRDAEEHRDIGVMRRRGGEWTAGIVHADRWMINGCPVNGPDVATRGTTAVVGWFTGPFPGKVQVAFSRDGGGEFGPPTRVEMHQSLGRVDVELLEPDRAVVTWMEVGASGESMAEVLTRTVSADGSMGEVRRVARTSSSNDSGLPRVAVGPSKITWAWTRLQEGKRHLEVASALRKAL